MNLIAGLIAFTPIDELAAGALLGVKRMRPLLFLMLGLGLVYLGLTGKADRTLKAAFGRMSSGGGGGGLGGAKR